MDTLALLLLLSIPVVVAAVLFLTQEQHRRSLITKTVVVNTKDDQSIRGVLYAQHSDRLSLTQAVYIDGQSELPINGLTHVPLSNIAWIQELPGSE